MSWPPDLYADLAGAAGSDFSRLIVDSALAITPDQYQRVRDIADVIDGECKRCMRARLAHASKSRAKQATELPPPPAQFVDRAVFLRAEQLPTLSGLARRAGFLSADDPQPTGSPLSSKGSARSFAAFLRAAAVFRTRKVQL